MKDLYSNAVENTDFDDSSKERNYNLLCKYSNNFFKTTQFQDILVIEHELDIGDSKPIKLPPRRVHRAYADTELQLIKGVKNQGIIQKSKSPWATLLNQVMKKNVKVRPCIDYRKVNGVT